MRTVHFFTSQQRNSGQLTPIPAYLLTSKIKPHGYVSFTGFCKDTQGTRPPLQSGSILHLVWSLRSALWGKLFVGLGGEAKRARGRREVPRALAGVRARRFCHRSPVHHTHQSRGTGFFIKAHEPWGVPAAAASR